MYCAPGRNPLYSEHGQWIPQYTVEEVMRAHIQSLPDVEMRFNTVLKTISQDEECVQAHAVDLPSGKAYTIHADYLIGADGARSLVREAIGAKLEGSYGLSRNYNVVFRAPGLAEAHKLSIEVDPVPGEQMQELVARISGFDRTVIDRALELTVMK